jgi:hypothetical protein
MRKQRDLKVCIALIRAVLTQGGLEPKQKDALDNALRTIKELRRAPSANRHIVYQAVRTITEELVKAFIKHY